MSREPLALEAVLPVIEAIARRRLSLSAWRYDVAEEVREVVQDVSLRLLESQGRLGGDAVQAWEAYAARITYRVLLERSDRRGSAWIRLRDRVRLLCQRREGLALGEQDGQRVIARTEQLARAVVPITRCDVRRLGQHLGPTGDVERLIPAVLEPLVRALLDQVDGPLMLDGVTNLLHEVLALPGESRGAAAPLPDDLAAVEVSAEDAIIHRDRVRRAWARLRQLPDQQRMVFLLNPGRGLDITAILDAGVVAFREVADALPLSAEHAHRAWAAMGDETDRRLTQTHPGGYVPPALLWNHVPVPDTVIGSMLGLVAHQVSSQRMLGGRNLARFAQRADATEAT